MSPEEDRLPRTLEGFIKMASAWREADSAGAYDVANRFGAIYPCDVCGRPIMQARVLAEALSAHYGSPESRSAVEDCLRRGVTETGDTLSPNYCSEHGQIESE